MAFRCLRSDPCGILCIIITYAAVAYADYVVIVWLIQSSSLSSSVWGTLNMLLFNLIVVLLVTSHARAVLSDPGLVPLPTTAVDFSDMMTNQMPSTTITENGEEWSLCQKCEVYRPPRSHHCRICKRCIMRMDHHCPWINNCVGELNQKFFIQFLFYTGVLSLHASVLTIVTWALGCQAPCIKLTEYERSTRVAHSIALVIESILFGLFVCAITCDQFNSIMDDETAVEHVKKSERKRPQRPAMVLLTEVFGRGSKWLWLCPIRQVSPVSYSVVPTYEV